MFRTALVLAGLLFLALTIGVSAQGNKNQPSFRLPPAHSSPPSYRPPTYQQPSYRPPAYRPPVNNLPATRPVSRPPASRPIGKPSTDHHNSETTLTKRPQGQNPLVNGSTSTINRPKGHTPTSNNNTATANTKRPLGKPIQHSNSTTGITQRPKGKTIDSTLARTHARVGVPRLPGKGGDPGRKATVITKKHLGQISRQSRLTVRNPGSAGLAVGKKSTTIASLAGRPKKGRTPSTTATAKIDPKGKGKNGKLTPAQRNQNAQQLQGYFANGPFNNAFLNIVYGLFMGLQMDNILGTMNGFASALDSSGPDGFEPAYVDTDDGNVVDGGFIPDGQDGVDGPGTGFGIIPDSGALNLTAEEVVETKGQIADLTNWYQVRYLEAANKTNQKITLYFKVEALNDSNDWDWGPSEPDSIDIEPGQTVELALGDWRVNGRRARIWATSGDRSWNRFQNEDLWLVPETVSGSDGDEHKYESPKIQTFVFYVQ